MQADTSGATNAPDMEAAEEAPKAAAAQQSKGDEDPFADVEEQEKDPFAEEEESAEAGTTQGKYSDAVSVQLPWVMPSGFELPYFLFGDSKNPVELWFSDLAAKEGKIYQGKGSASLKPASDSFLTVLSNFDNGRWSVIFKRARNVKNGLSLAGERVFVPVAFSVWDGFDEERGNKRGLTSWYNLYLTPSKKESPWGKMALYALVLLAAEIAFIKVVRRRM